MSQIRNIHYIQKYVSKLCFVYYEVGIVYVHICHMGILVITVPLNDITIVLERAHQLQSIGRICL